MVTLEGLVTQHLKNFSFNRPAGCITALLGLSALEIHDLFQILALRTLPQDGQYLLDKQNVLNLPAKLQRIKAKQVAWIHPQLLLLDHQSVLQNLALPLQFAGIFKDQAINTMEPLIELFDLQHKLHCCPPELNPFQKIKLALARALLFKPKLLLIQNWTLHLPFHQMNHLAHLLRAWVQAAQSVILWQTTQLQAIKNAIDQITVFKNGRVIEDCGTTQFFSDPQTDIGQDLIREQTLLDLPLCLQQNLSMAEQNTHAPLIRLSFAGKTMQEPWLPILAEKFQLQVNIIQAYTEQLASMAYSVLVLQLIGKKEQLDQSIQFIKTKGFHVSVIGYLPAEAA